MMFPFENIFGTFRKFLATMAIMAFVAVAGSSARGAEVMRVTIDEAALLRLPVPAAQIILGNPAIADVAIQDSKLLVVTGKAYGSTNVIVLDHKGDVITERRLTVVGNTAGRVTLFKGSARYSYQCDDTCNGRLAIGDAKEHVDLIERSTQKKFSLSTYAMEAGQAAQ